MLQKEHLQHFFEKRLKSHTRMYLKPAQWEKLDTKDKAFIIAEALKQYKALHYEPSLIKETIIPIASEHPTKFAMGLGKTTTYFFFHGLGPEAELFFKTLGKDVEKFVKRIYYKDQFAAGVDANALGKGISKSIDQFAKGMGKEGLEAFHKALKKSNKKNQFIIGLGGSLPLYLDAAGKLTGKPGFF